jgi:DNA-directed RNA polymerase specialized sigma24 family protein
MPSLGAVAALYPRCFQVDQAGCTVTDSSLEQVMQVYAGGDAQAFEQLYSRVSTLLYSYLLTLTRDQPRAEKLLQTTFAKVHKARSSYIPGTPFVPWILAIARTAFLDEPRKDGGKSAGAQRTAPSCRLLRPDAGARN